MTTEIRIYVEGGGDGKDSKASFRSGLDQFLSSLKDSARRSRIPWQTVACGPRWIAIDNFQLALRQHPDAFNVLLVDAEGPLNCAPREHLGLTQSGLHDESCHLMVQLMEAWFLADTACLKAFYGPHFHDNLLSDRRNVEEIDKSVVEDILQRATRDTQKGTYHKSRHAPQLLESLDSNHVRGKAPNCDRLFRTLESKLTS